MFERDHLSRAVAAVEERITALYENSTPEVKVLIGRHRAALYDPRVLSALERAPKPISREALIKAVADSALGDDAEGNG